MARRPLVAAAIGAALVLVSAGSARAQDAGLVLFGMSNPPGKHPIPFVAAQTEKQVTLYRGLLDVKQPNEHQVELCRRLRDSLFSVARFAINDSLSARNQPGLASALLPLTSEDMNRAYAKRDGAYAEPTSPLGRIAFLYDVARAVRICLTRQDGGFERAPALALLRNLIGAVPYEQGREDRRFITQFEIHGWFQRLFPAVATSGGHRFKDYVNLVEVDGETGRWTNGLATALTERGRRDNTDRLLRRIDALEYSSSAPTAGLTGNVPR